MKMKIFGKHDEATIAQIERCVARSDWSYDYAAVVLNHQL